MDHALGARLQCWIGKSGMTEVYHYGPHMEKQIREEDIIPVDGMWIHVCAADRNALMAVGKGEPCNYCGAREHEQTVQNPD